MSIGRREFLAGVAAAGGAALLGPTAGTAQQPRQRRYSKPVYDLHFHWYPPEFGDVILKEGAANGVTDIRQDGWSVSAKIPGNHPYGGGGRASFRRQDMTDVDMILKMADDRDVDLSVVTQTNPHVLWASPEFGATLARAINDGNSALHVKHPTRFIGTMTLPMQDVKLALDELERARKLPGMRAVNMTENILGKNLHRKEFWPVWAKCEEYGLPLFLKNVDPVSERLVEDDFNLMLTLGNPFEATIAAACLVAGGVMDAFPKLEVYLPHAGGVFAFVAPRMDFSMKQGSFKNLKQQPVSAYLRRFHYDLILHSPKLTRTLIDQVGADRVASGTDYPQAMAIVNPSDYVEAIPGITKREAEMILCENPARLLKMS